MAKKENSNVIRKIRSTRKDSSLKPSPSIGKGEKKKRKTKDEDEESTVEERPDIDEITMKLEKWRQKRMILRVGYSKRFKPGRAVYLNMRKPIVDTFVASAVINKLQEETDEQVQNPGTYVVSLVQLPAKLVEQRVDGSFATEKLSQPRSHHAQSGRRAHHRRKAQKGRGPFAHVGIIQGQLKDGHVILHGRASQDAALPEEEDIETKPDDTMRFRDLGHRGKAR
jgi:hypothetical protein